MPELAADMMISSITQCTRLSALAALVLTGLAAGAAAQEVAVPPPSLPPAAVETPAPASPPVAEPPAVPAATDLKPAEGAPAAAPPNATEAEAVAPTSPAAPTAPLPRSESAPAKSSALPHDLSPWGMFMAADIVVKVVMIGLALASVITWIIWAAKVFELWAGKLRLRKAIRKILAAQHLAEAADMFGHSRSTGAILVREAGHELTRSLATLDQLASHDLKAGIKERVTSRLSRVEANAGRRMTLGTGVLATIGATAPFVGLFGTVWGIMNSFIGISQSQTTNLAVVAPGIAEALLATAIGLVAAIPAVIIYNGFARSIAGYRLLLADASAGVERLVSWELDARELPRSVRPAVPGAAE